MPFGKYKDFDACVKDNKNKDNPEAFCSWLHHKITGKWPREAKENSMTIVRRIAKKVVEEKIDETKCPGGKQKSKGKGKGLGKGKSKGPIGKPKKAAENLIKEIVDDVIENFEKITGVDPADTIDRVNEDGQFIDEIIDKTSPKIIDYVKDKYNVDITTEYEDVLYKLDEEIMSKYARKTAAMGLTDPAFEKMLDDIGIPMSRAKSIKTAADAVQSMLVHMDGNNKAKFTPDLSNMTLREFANMFKGHGEVTV